MRCSRSRHSPAVSRVYSHRRSRRRSSARNPRTSSGVAALSSRAITTSQRRRVVAALRKRRARPRNRDRGHQRGRDLGFGVRGHVGAHWTTFVLRTPVFALGAALRVDWTTFVLRTPVFALGAALRAHAARLRRGAERHPRPRARRAGIGDAAAGVAALVDRLPRRGRGERGGGRAGGGGPPPRGPARAQRSRTGVHARASGGFIAK